MRRYAIVLASGEGGEREREPSQRSTCMSIEFQDHGDPSLLDHTH
jgi:hypothetical protein